MNKSKTETVLDILRSKTIGSLNEAEKKLVLSTLGDETSVEEWHEIVQELHSTMRMQSKPGNNYDKEIAWIKTEHAINNKTEIKSFFNYKIKLYKVLLAAAVLSAVMFLFITQKQELESKSSGVSVKDHPFLTENFVQSTD